MSKKKKIAIIDSHALIHRAYHALPPMSMRDGTPTNAAYGFTSMLLKMFSVVKPTHVVATFDMKGKTFRHKLFPDYKAHRGAAADDLVAQFGLVEEVVRVFNIPVFKQKGFEADDLIGTLVKEISDKAEKIIVTGDMDTLQLVDDHTKVFTLKRGISDTILYNEELVYERYGFGPELVCDYKGLRGDPSDNIPGLEGIGEKTAKDLVGEYGSIENIYAHFDELPNRAQSRMRGKQKEAKFSRKLATIRQDVPIKFSLDDCELADFNVEKVGQLFEKLEFKNMMTRLPKSKQVVQPSLFKNEKKNDSKKNKLPDNYFIAESKQEQDKLIKKISKLKVVAFDTETDKLGARDCPIVGMSFAWRKGKSGDIESWYVPVDPKGLLNWKNVLEDKSIEKVGHNLKYDVAVCRQSEIDLRPVKFDSMIASYLLHPGSRQHSLNTLAVQELDHHPIPITDLIGVGKDAIGMSQVPLDKIAPYACEDADLTWQFYEIFTEQIKEEKLEFVLKDIELPLIKVLVDIELAGVKIDQAQLKKLDEKVSERIDVLRQEIWKLGGGDEFNVNSTQQLREILFDKLKLPTEGIMRTQSGYSTAAAELEKLRDQHPIIRLLEEYRELSKLLNTYIATLPELIKEGEERIYASFNQTIAATGRLSSSNPNLQNIPARTESGQAIRAAFVAGEGNKLIKADYSQLELRVVAHMANDEKMIDAFRKGEDIHTATAAWVNDVKIKEVTKKQRYQAKTLNFGVLYGMGPNRFAREADISLEEARSFIERYKDQYEGIVELIQETIFQAEEVGFVQTLFGRKRYVPEINSGAPSVRAGAERAAFNFPIQGTAADILKKAMIALHVHMKEKYPGGRIILTVHDELVCEIDDKFADDLAKDMKEIMEKIYTLDVPLIVDVEMGDNWRDMTSIFK